MACSVRHDGKAGVHQCRPRGRGAAPVVRGGPASRGEGHRVVEEEGGDAALRPACRGRTNPTCPASPPPRSAVMQCDRSSSRPHLEPRWQHDWLGGGDRRCVFCRQDVFLAVLQPVAGAGLAHAAVPVLDRLCGAPRAPRQRPRGARVDPPRPKEHVLAEGAPHHLPHLLRLPVELVLQGGGREGRAVRHSPPARAGCRLTRGKHGRLGRRRGLALRGAPSLW
mmetsp:Transcript_28871/g.92181  ORF Transcript_28871/g.92181 Transcript_28871/m.92181 type:complete len:223 (+) Transcript_28871:663-1331(+)